MLGPRAGPHATFGGLSKAKEPTQRQQAREAVGVGEPKNAVIMAGAAEVHVMAIFLDALCKELD